MKMRDEEAIAVGRGEGMWKFWAAPKLFLRWGLGKVAAALDWIGKPQQRLHGRVER